MIIGSSRAYRGLDPRVFESLDSGRRYFNFGFSSVEMTADYLRHAEQLLRPGAQHPTIIISTEIPNYALISRKNSHYNAIAKTNRLDRLVTLFTNRLRTKPVPSPIVWQESGFASSTDNGDHHKEGLAQSKKLLETADSKLIQEDWNAMVAAIKRWRSLGIRVFVVRMPTTDAMEALEGRSVGVGRAEMRKAFTAAGAKWIELPNSYDEVLDSSHLNAAGANRISKIVAKLILEERSE